MPAPTGLFKRTVFKTKPSPHSQCTSQCGLRLSEEYHFGRGQTIQIINNSKYVIYVIFHDPPSRLAIALDPGHCGVYPIIKDTVRVTLSYYQKDREMKDLCTQCLFNKGRLLHIVQ